MTKENNPDSLEGMMGAEGLQLPEVGDATPEQTLARALEDMSNLAQREATTAGRAASAKFFENQGMDLSRMSGGSIQNMISIADQNMRNPIAERARSISGLVEQINTQRAQSMEMATHQMNQLVETGQWNDLLEQNPKQAKELWTAAGKLGSPHRMRTPEPEIFGNQQTGYYRFNWDENANDWVKESILPGVSEDSAGGLLFNLEDPETGESEQVDLLNLQHLIELRKRDDVDLEYEDIFNAINLNSNLHDFNPGEIRSFIETAGWQPPKEQERTIRNETIENRLLQEYLITRDMGEARELVLSGGMSRADRDAMQAISHRLEQRVPYILGALGESVEADLDDGTITKLEGHEEFRQFLEIEDLEAHGITANRMINQVLKNPQRYIWEDNAIYERDGRTIFGNPKTGDKLFEFTQD